MCFLHVPEASELTPLLLRYVAECVMHKEKHIFHFLNKAYALIACLQFHRQVQHYYAECRQSCSTPKDHVRRQNCHLLFFLDLQPSDRKEIWSSVNLVNADSKQ